MLTCNMYARNIFKIYLKNVKSFEIYKIKKKDKNLVYAGSGNQKKILMIIGPINRNNPCP